MSCMLMKEAPMMKHVYLGQASAMVGVMLWTLPVPRGRQRVITTIRREELVSAGGGEGRGRPINQLYLGVCKVWCEAEAIAVSRIDDHVRLGIINLSSSRASAALWSLSGGQLPPPVFSSRGHFPWPLPDKVNTWRCIWFLFYYAI